MHGWYWSAESKAKPTDRNKERLFLILICILPGVPVGNRYHRRGALPGSSRAFGCVINTHQGSLSRRNVPSALIFYEILQSFLCPNSPWFSKDFPWGRCMQNYSLCLEGVWPAFEISSPLYFLPQWMRPYRFLKFPFFVHHTCGMCEIW